MQRLSLLRSCPMRQGARRVHCARAARVRLARTPKAPELGLCLRGMPSILHAITPAGGTKPAKPAQRLARASITQHRLIMAHPGSGNVRPEDESIRPVEAQVQRDRPRDRRDGRLAARHDVRVATHERVLRRGPRVVHVEACVEIKILRRVRAESSRRPPRHRRGACSMAWRCRFLTARRSQHGSVIAKNDLVKNYRVHPTHWLVSTQILTGQRVHGLILFLEGKN